MLVNLGLATDTPVHEDISLPAMSVHVAEEDDLILFVVGSDELLGIVNSGVQNFGRIRPSSIQISADHVTPIIADHHAVWVEHRHDFENEGVS